MTILTLNTISLKANDIAENVIDSLIYELAVSIEKFWKFKENKQSRFYSDLEDLMNLDLREGYTFLDSLKKLNMELRQPIFEFFSMKCTKNCINDASDEDLESLTTNDLYFKDHGNKIEDSLLLLYCLEKNTFLLSFNVKPWNQYKIPVSRINKETINYLELKNIAHKDHVNSHIKDHVLKRMNNISPSIIYSEEVKQFILNENESTQDKILLKIQQCENTNFKIDMDLIKSLNENIFEIRVGSKGGLEHSQIRILFKFDKTKKYLVWYFIKHGQNKYDESADITKANEILKKLKEEEKK